MSRSENGREPAPVHNPAISDNRVARISCYRERQGGFCGQRSAFVDGIDDQVTAFLATLPIPEETVAELATRYDQLAQERDEAEQEWRRLSARLERIKELSKWGDLTREANLAERDEREQRLAGFRGVQIGRRYCDGWLTSCATCRLHGRPQHRTSALPWRGPSSSRWISLVAL